MKWDILRVSDTNKWHEILNRFSQTDIYFLPEYHTAYEVNGDGVAYAFVVQSDEHLLFYPFFLRSINRVGVELLTAPWYDIETVYGYSGPLATTSDPTFLSEAWRLFGGWCSEQQVVAEFIRFNPLVKNWSYVDQSCRVTSDRKTVIMNLACTEAELWASYPSIHRNMVRKAINKGLMGEELSLADGMDVFRQLYYSTMERNQASAYYYFSDAYFNYLRNLTANIRVFVVRLQSEIIAAALFLHHGDCLHYHLAASVLKHKSFAPNNLLLHTVAIWGQRQGLHRLHLGGGRTSSPEDSLFRFKASVSNLRLSYYQGRRVHHSAMYEQLCSMWMCQHQKDVNACPNHFLLYRLQEEHESRQV